MKCASCASKKTDRQCSFKVVAGTRFCAKHNRSKNFKLWIDESNETKPATTIQKIWKGYKLRKLLKLAGPGVLNRSVCHNDEELVSLEDKSKFDPFDYFSFEESGKIYWFSKSSIMTIVSTEITPLNPYTRQPLTTEPLERLWDLLQKNPKLLRDENITYEILSEKNWMIISQIMLRNGFEDLHLHKTTLNDPKKLYTFLYLFFKDLTSWSKESPQNIRNLRYAFQIKMLFLEFCKKRDLRTMLYISYSTLLDIFLDSRYNYDICFMFMSAMFRL